MIGFIDAVILGLGLAAVYTLVAQGLVLIYRGSGIVNFAQGAFAMVGGYTFYELNSTLGLPSFVAVIASVVAGIALGLIMQFAVMRPLRNAAPIVRVIATLGLFLLLQSIGGLIYGPRVSYAEPILPGGFIRLGELTIQIDRIILFGLAVVLTLVLMYIRRRSLVGLATSAAAESERSASTLGWSPNLLATINWSAGGALAGLGGALIAPQSALTVNSLTLLVIPALAAALVGRFDSFGWTLIGAVIIAVLQSLSIRYVTLTGFQDAIPFFIILIVLVVSGKGLPSRGESGDKLPSIGTGRIRPIYLLVGAVVGAVLFLFVFDNTWSDAIGISLGVAILLLSLVVVTGYAGQVSLAQLTLGGIGAWIAGKAVAELGWPFELALLAGVAVAIPIGAIFALPALRTRGVNLAVVTLGLAYVVQRMVFDSVDLTGGAGGTPVGRTTIFGLDVSAVVHPERWGFVTLIAFIIAGLAVANLRRSAMGRRLIAIRGNERGAASLGISVVRGKLYAFSIAAGIAALGGIILAFRSDTIIYSGAYGVIASIQQMALAVIGGVGYVLGPIIGSTLTAGGVSSLLSPLLSGIDLYLPLLAGVFLVLMIVTNPDGQVPVMIQWGKAIGARFSKARAHSKARRRMRHQGRVDAKLGALIDEASAQGVRVEPQTLELDDLTIAYGGITAVDHVSFRVEPGQIIGLIGPNGAGKTSLIDGLSGFTRLSAGAVRLNGKEITSVRAHLRARRGLARSWQSLELFEDVSVLENIQVASEHSRWFDGLLGLVRPERLRLSHTAAAAIAEFRDFGMIDDLSAKTGDLSFSQRRLLATVRAVAYGPSVLLLDEPTSGMSDTRRADFAAVVRRLASDWGMAILLVDHDMPFVMEVCDEIVVMETGRKIAQGTPEQVRTDPAVIEAYLPPEDEATTVRAERDLSMATSVRADRVLIEARGLAAGYNGVPVVQGIEFDVRAGEVFALLGGNRAGKTTTVLALAGEIPLLAGEVYRDGSAVAARTPLFRRAKDGLGFVTDERSVFMKLTVDENLRLGRCDRGLALELFPELEPLLDRRAGLLSGGEQQMLGLGRALARRPEVLMVDEMSLGLAPMIVTRLLQALRKAADEQGIGVVLIEQHVEQALAYADRVGVIAGGRMAVSGSVAEVGHRVEEAYLADVLGTREVVGTAV